MQTLHWFWTSFFAVFGVALLCKPKFLAADCLGRGLLGLRESEQQRRAVQALHRRLDAERISAVPGYAGGTGALIIAAVSAFSSVQPVVYYALFSLWVSAAWRLTQLPALLQGEDLAAEVYVDNRLRVNRSVGPLILAVVQPFALSAVTVQADGVQFSAMVLSTAMFFGGAIWCVYSMYKPASLAAA